MQREDRLSFVILRTLLDVRAFDLPLPCRTMPPVLEFVVEPLFRGKRIDSFLEKHLRNYTPYQLHRLLRAGCVSVNEVPVDVIYRLKTNEVVRLKLICPPDRCTIAEDLPLQVLYEDAWLLVVNKAPGVNAHPGGEYQSGTLINAVQRHLDQQTGLPGLLRPGMAHRIDRQTSGVIALPKDHLSHRNLTKQFELRTVNKSYRAILCGRLEPDSGSIDFPIGLVPNLKCNLMCAKPIARDPRHAKTLFRVIERFDNYTFVEAKPVTGRHHQIRIHFAELGYPLLADEFYGPHGELKDGTPLGREPDSPVACSTSPTGETSREEFTAWFDVEDDEDEERAESAFFDPDLPMRRHALHAATLSFNHPITQLPMGFEAPLHDDMESTLQMLRNRTA